MEAGGLLTGAASASFKLRLDNAFLWSAEVPWLYARHRSSRRRPSSPSERLPSERRIGRIPRSSAVSGAITF